MMTPEQIAAMRADAEAGTPGPWMKHSNASMITAGNQIIGHFIANPNVKADTRRIARVPDMEATIIAQAAEIERLNEMLAVQWEGIPWRDGPPPAEWRDGREVLVWAKNAHHVRWGAGSWHVINGSGAQIVQSMITHHAAITSPHEKGQPG